MTLDELEQEWLKSKTPSKPQLQLPQQCGQTCGEATYPKWFIVENHLGEAQYMTMTEDGRLIPIDEFQFGD